MRDLKSIKSIMVGALILGMSFVLLAGLSPYDGKFDTAFYNRACIRALKGNLADAILDLKKAIELSPTNIERAIVDSDFDFIKGSKEFKELMLNGMSD
ncbi:MAG: tetratricopeptide repeat protein [Caulobacteraceae bacterium]